MEFGGGGSITRKYSSGGNKKPLIAILDFKAKGNWHQTKVIDFFILFKSSSKIMKLKKMMSKFYYFAR